MLLAIDTASQLMSLALHDGQQVWYEATWRTANNHTVELTPAIQRAFTQARLAPADLTAVAVSQGPGSFTGLRIGLGVAKGLAMACSIPLVAVPTLEIVAAGVPYFHGMLVAALQAGRGRVCAQSFHWHKSAWLPGQPPEITTWDNLIQAVEHETLFAGEIDEAGHKRLDATDRPVRIAPGAVALRRAGFLAELAWVRLDANELDPPANILPIYLNQPGAASA